MKKQKLSDNEVSVALRKTLVYNESFAEVWLYDEWVKVEVVTREGLSEGNYLVERIDGRVAPFKIKAQELTSFGSHDSENKRQIWKREGFKKLEELLKEKDCAIERVKGYGSCLFRAVARQIYGDQEQYQKVRFEIAEWVITHKKYFSVFGTDIDERISEQLMNRSWGGDLELEAMSEHYNVGIFVWELSQSGLLVAPFDNTTLAASKGLQILYLVRHVGVHYNVVVGKNRELPVIRTGGPSLRSEVEDAQLPSTFPPESRDKDWINYSTLHCHKRVESASKLDKELLEPKPGRVDHSNTKLLVPDKYTVPEPQPKQVDESVDLEHLVTGAGKEPENRTEADIESAMHWEANESEEKLL